MDVESFWKSTTVEQRRELLRVPMSSLLHGTALVGCGPCEFEGCWEGRASAGGRGNRRAVQASGENLVSRDLQELGTTMLDRRGSAQGLHSRRAVLAPAQFALLACL